MDIRLKPNKRSFIVMGFSKRVLIGFVVCSVLFFWLRIFIKSPLLPISLLLFFIFVVIFFWIEQHVSYKKRLYIIQDNKIIQHSGSIFSTEETELVVRNITHIKMKLPFLANHFFGTGHLLVEAAGTRAAEIHMDFMDSPHNVRDQITELMKNNGFGLKADQLILTEQPSTLGVFFEVFKNFIFGTLFILAMADDAMKDGNFSYLEKHFWGFVILVVLCILVVQVFSFLDLKKRKYKIFSDVISYDEGFLTKNHVFIPYENLSDSSTTQTLVDRLFGLFDIKISCQGSQHEILFKNLKNGQGISDTLDRLFESYQTHLKTVDQQEKSVETEVHKTLKIKTKQHLIKNSEYVAEFKMDRKRTLLPIIILFAFIVILAVLAGIIFEGASAITPLLIGVLVIYMITFLISQTIKISSTKFSIKNRSIEYQYQFLNSKKIEFAVDKITGIVIRRNIIDRLFDTLSVQFWSIGSGANLNFSNLKRSDQLVTNILSKFGIKPEAENYRLTPSFSVLESVRSYIFSYFFGFLFIAIGIFIAHRFVGQLVWWCLGLVILIFISNYIYTRFYYRKSVLIFCDNFIYFHKGLISNEFYYVLYDDIKDIVTTHYPFSSEGSIRFNVAGEHTLDTQEETQRIGIVSYQDARYAGGYSHGFTIRYIQAIALRDELIDFILKRRPNRQEITNFSAVLKKNPSTKILLSSKPSLSNALLAPSITGLLLLLCMGLLIGLVPGHTDRMGIILVFSILLFIVAVWFFVTLIITRCITYIIEDYRVLERTGVFYKRQKSIIFEKIDFISSSQRFLNKIFKNGNIIVNTVSSSRAELVIKNIGNCREFYRILKDSYEKS